MHTPLSDPHSKALFPIETQALADSLTEWRDGLPTTVIAEADILRNNRGLFTTVTEIGFTLGSNELIGSSQYSMGALISHHTIRNSLPNRTVPRISEVASVLTAIDFASALDPAAQTDHRVKSILDIVTPVMLVERDMDAVLLSLSGGVGNLTYLGGAVMTACLKNGILHDSRQ